MIEYPTADQVAVTIVAAARETGEDPVACIEGEYGLHCRHYAAHALRRVLPEMMGSTCARVVGSNNPSCFWTSSNNHVVNRKFKWWDGAVLDRIEGVLRAHVGSATSPEDKPRAALISGCEEEAAGGDGGAEDETDLTTSSALAHVPMFDITLGEPEEPAPPENDGVSVDSSSGRVSFGGKVCILAGRPLQMVFEVASVMPRAVDRSELRDELFPGEKRTTAEMLLPGVMKAANERLRSIGLRIESVRGTWFALEPITQD